MLGNSSVFTSHMFRKTNVTTFPMTSSRCVKCPRKISAPLLVPTSMQIKKGHGVYFDHVRVFKTAWNVITACRTKHLQYIWWRCSLQVWMTGHKQQPCLTCWPGFSHRCFCGVGESKKEFLSSSVPRAGLRRGNRAWCCVAKIPNVLDNGARLFDTHSHLCYKCSGYSQESSRIKSSVFIWG